MTIDTYFMYNLNGMLGIEASFFQVKNTRASLRREKAQEMIMKRNLRKQHWFVDIQCYFMFAFLSV